MSLAEKCAALEDVLQKMTHRHQELVKEKREWEREREELEKTQRMLAVEEALRKGDDRKEESEFYEEEEYFEEDEDDTEDDDIDHVTDNAPRMGGETLERALRDLTSQNPCVACNGGFCMDDVAAYCRKCKATYCFSCCCGCKPHEDVRPLLKGSFSGFTSLPQDFDTSRGSVAISSSGHLLAVIDNAIPRIFVFSTSLPPKMICEHPLNMYHHLYAIGGCGPRFYVGYGVAGGDMVETYDFQEAKPVVHQFQLIYKEGAVKREWVSLGVYKNQYVYMAAVSGIGVFKVNSKKTNLNEVGLVGNDDEAQLRQIDNCLRIANLVVSGDRLVTKTGIGLMVYALSLADLIPVPIHKVLCNPMCAVSSGHISMYGTTIYYPTAPRVRCYPDNMWHWPKEWEDSYNSHCPPYAPPAPPSKDGVYYFYQTTAKTAVYLYRNKRGVYGIEGYSADK